MRAQIRRKPLQKRVTVLFTFFGAGAQKPEALSDRDFAHA